MSMRNSVSGLGLVATVLGMTVGMQFATAANSTYTLNQKEISIPETEDVTLVQTAHTPADKVFIDKSCTKNRDVCLHYERRYRCWTEWRRYCDPYYPYGRCWDEPITQCGWESYCTDWGKEPYTVRKDVRIIFEGAKLFGDQQREYTLSCGSPDEYRKVYLTPSSTDVRIKRGFWRTNTFKVLWLKPENDDMR